MKRFIRENLLTILLFLAMLAIWICIPHQIKAQVSTQGGISPRFFPRFSAACVLLCTGLTLLVNGVRSGRKPADAERGAEKDQNVSYLRPFWVVAMLLLWYAAVKPVGFCISTALLLFGISLLLGNRNKLTLTLVPVCFSFGVYFLFRMLLHVALPEVLF